MKAINSFLALAIIMLIASIVLSTYWYLWGFLLAFFFAIVFFGAWGVFMVLFLVCSTKFLSPSFLTFFKNGVWCYKVKKDGTLEQLFKSFGSLISSIEELKWSKIDIKNFCEEKPSRINSKYLHLFLFSEIIDHNENFYVALVRKEGFWDAILRKSFKGLLSGKNRKFFIDISPLKDERILKAKYAHRLLTPASFLANSNCD